MTFARASLLLFIFVSFSPQVFALCVQNSFANLRQGPGTGYEKSWKVYKFMPFEEVKKEKGWLQVKDVDGDQHWVRGDLVTDKFKCAVIKNEYANLRQGPGTQFPPAKAGKGQKYLSFKVLEEKANWVKVEDSQGDEAWVYRPLIWIK